jgi:hypothetical protein
MIDLKLEYSRSTRQLDDSTEPSTRAQAEGLFAGGNKFMQEDVGGDCFLCEGIPARFSRMVS